MSTTSNSLPLEEAPKTNYLNAKYGISSWLLTLDHKRIGILYIITLSIFFALGGVYAGLIRLESRPGSSPIVTLVPAPDPKQQGTVAQLLAKDKRLERIAQDITTP